MKVQNNQPLQVDVGNILGKRPTDATKEFGAAAKPGERVSFSADAVNFKQIETDLQAVPDVRMDVVNRLKAEVDAGTYERPADKVADAMINSSLIESLYRG
jgi:flagellar biosynthesis anti-sigma factor FlgM